MPKQSLSARLAAGKASHHLYNTEKTEGLVSIWEHQGNLILTWEECSPGQQYDESQYTRDERHVFPSYDELLVFLSQNGLAADAFSA